MPTIYYKEIPIVTRYEKDTTDDEWWSFPADKLKGGGNLRKP
jgi:hypothetical protein